MKFRLLLCTVAVLLCGCSADSLLSSSGAPDSPPSSPAQATFEAVGSCIDEGPTQDTLTLLADCADRYRALEATFTDTPAARDAATEMADLLDLLSAEEIPPLADGMSQTQAVTEAVALARTDSSYGDYFPDFDPEHDPVLALAGRAVDHLYTVDQAAGRLVITAAGDTTFGEYPEVPKDISFNTEFARRGEDLGFPLRLVSPFFRADDLTILNCEGTFTQSDDAAQKTYRFKGPASYAQMFSRGDVELVNLANNHAFDYKEQGYADTREALADVGVGFWGDEELYLTQQGDVTVGCVGYNLFNIEPDLSEVLPQHIAALQEQGAQLVIVNFHWGYEYGLYVNEYQQRTARQAVDAGAGLVLGHHPHVLQGAERYKGVSILYSLGNFAFGGDEDLKDRDTLVFRQSFAPGEDGSLVAGDILLQPAYLSTSDVYNNYSPWPVFGDEAERIAAKVIERSAHLPGGFTREDFSLLS